MLALQGAAAVRLGVGVLVPLQGAAAFWGDWVLQAWVLVPLQGAAGVCTWVLVPLQGAAAVCGCRC